MEKDQGLTIEKRMDVLRGVQTFMGLNKDVLLAIAKKLKQKDVPAGGNIFNKGEEAYEMYVIVSGVVSVHDERYEFSKMRKGSIFGEYSLFDKEIRSASSTAETDCVLLALSRHDFMDVLQQNQELVFAIIRQLVLHIRQKDALEKQLTENREKLLIQKEKIEVQKKNMERQNERLLELNDEKNHLISILAHDLRNPLTSALSVANMLEAESEALDEDVQSGMKLIARSLQRMDDMIGRILDLRTIDSQLQQINLKQVNISNLIRQLIGEFEEHSRRKNIQIHFAPKDHFAYLDKEFARQIYENIISNGLKFSPSNTLLKIRLWEEGNAIKTAISDQGPGISKEEMPKLFGRFQRLSAKPTAGEPSTGLGLSIVKKYVEMMEGKVWCESELGQGSTFFVEFQKNG